MKTDYKFNKKNIDAYQFIVRTLSIIARPLKEGEKVYNEYFDIKDMIAKYIRHYDEMKYLLMYV